MNLFQLIAKNMRQRALSTWLTLLSVALGTALGVALLVFQKQAQQLFGQSEFGYNLVIAAKGSPLQATLNNVYFLDQPTGTMEWSLYETLRPGSGDRLAGYVQWAVPIAWGDTHEGRRIIGTTPALFGYDDAGTMKLPEDRRFEPRVNRPLTFATGGPFQQARWQAVLGSEAAQALRANLGYTFEALHGSEETGHLHEEEWEVVGILAPTGTAIDKAIYVPIETELAIGEHSTGLYEQLQVRIGTEQIQSIYDERAKALDALVNAGGTRHESYVEAVDGRVVPNTPPPLWGISGILVKTSGSIGAPAVQFGINNGNRATAAVPAEQMRIFFDTFLKGPTQLLLLVTALVTVVAAVSILVSIYNSVSARRREIAILRSLGATRNKVLALVTLEATIVGVVGAGIGFVLGHALAAGGSEMLRRQLGEGIDWWAVGPLELAYLAGVITLAFLAGLVPALKAYGTPVAQNLSE